MLVAPALGGTALAAEQPTTNGHGHGKVVFPTRSNAPSAKYAGAASGTGQLRYGGAVDGIGVTTGPPKVYLVFYGSQWGTAGTDASGNTTYSGDSKGEAPRVQ